MKIRFIEEFNCTLLNFHSSSVEGTSSFSQGEEMEVLEIKPSAKPGKSNIKYGENADGTEDWLMNIPNNAFEVC